MFYSSLYFHILLIDLDSICRDHPSGTYLPMVNRFDMYIICGNDGKSISKRCESGRIYNALTTACEKGNYFSNIYDFIKQ